MVEIAGVELRILDLEGHPSQMRRHESRGRHLPALNMPQSLWIAVALPVQREGGASREPTNLARDASLGQPQSPPACGRKAEAQLPLRAFATDMESLSSPKSGEDLELFGQRLGDAALPPTICDEFGHGACVTSGNSGRP